MITRHSTNSFISVFKILCFLFVFLCTYSITQAQITIQEGLKVDVYPKIPGVFEDVSITIQSFATDLNRAEISWYINGELVKQSVGARSLEFTTGDVGSRNEIEMVARTIEGRIFRQPFSFTPANVDLIWEALTYTPPFYQGRARYTRGAQVKVVAIPDLRKNGQQLDPNTLIYEWQVNRKNIPEASGYGKQSYTVSEKDTVNGPMIIGVTVSSRDGVQVAKKEISLQPQATNLTFYYFDPLLKTRYENALLDEYTISDSEATFVAVPYFFPGKNKNNSGMAYEWELNNTDVYPSVTDASVITLRPNENQSGKAELSVKVTHTNSMFARSSETLRLLFGSDSN